MEEKVFFENSKDEKLAGLLKINSDDKRIIIYVHGYGSSKDGKTDAWIVESLNKQNFNSLKIDLSGCGESEGLFENQTITSAIDDIKSAIKFVKLKGFNEINLLGVSAGGISSIGATLDNLDVKKLILISPVTNYIRQRIKQYGQETIDKWKEDGFIIHKKGNGKEYRVNYSFFEDVQKHIMVEKANRINCPVLIFHGTKDPVVSINDSREFVKALKNGKLIEIDGGTHNFVEGNYNKKVGELILEWLK